MTANTMTFEIPASLSEDTVMLLNGLSPELDHVALREVLADELIGIGDSLREFAERGDRQCPEAVEAALRLAQEAEATIRGLADLASTPPVGDKAEEGS